MNLSRKNVILIDWLIDWLICMIDWLYYTELYIQEEWEARKKVKQVAYQKFLTRGGAKNPGSKVVPEGSPGIA